MECSCSCDVCGEDFVEDFHRWGITTRKDHKCVECGDVIPKRSKAVCETYLFEERRSRTYTCTTCSNIRKDYGCDGMVAGALRHDIRCCLKADLL